MTSRRIALILACGFIAGVFAGVITYNRFKPSEAQRQQFAIDDAIRSKLCDRIKTDLGRYEEAPNAFKRSSLNELVNEARQVSKTLVPLSAAERGIDFRGTESTLVANCSEEAKRWVKITSVFPEAFEQELRVVGVAEEQSRWRAMFGAVTSTKPLPVARRAGRLALVIGNSDYHSGPLKNPRNDADDMAGFLRSADFAVHEVKDADLKKLIDVTTQFVDELKGAEVGLIYYSGHGIEFRGQNYLIPVDAEIKRDEEIPRMAFDIAELLERVNRVKPRAVVLIIDACRNTPIFSAVRGSVGGLGDMRSPTGTVIAFSAAPGQTAADGNGRNSPYTAALLQEMRVPNTPIEQVLKETRKAVSVATQDRQVPWYNSSLVGDFYFIRE